MEFGTVTAVTYKGQEWALVDFEDDASASKALKASAKYDGAALSIEGRKPIYKGTGGQKKKQKKKKPKHKVNEAPLLCSR
jgi:hypothetical protein